MPPLRVITYFRVSSDYQATKGTGVETQQIEADRLAERLGAVMVARESDSGIPGTIMPGSERPGILRALQMLQRGEADALIAYDATRIGRKESIIHFVWETIEAAGKRLFLCDMGEVTEANELMYALKEGLSKQELRKLRARTTAGRQRRAVAGIMPNRVWSPYGYHIVRHGETGPNGEQPGQYVIDEREARWVREIFQRIGAGDSLRKVCAWLQDAGVISPQAIRSKKAGPLLDTRHHKADHRQ